mgnify:CR=1 FL=1
MDYGAVQRAVQGFPANYGSRLSRLLSTAAMAIVIDRTVMYLSSAVNLVKKAGIV